MAEHDIARTKQLISRAALSLASWEEAVCAMAAASGSQTGQLIGLGMPGDLHFNIMTGIDPSALGEFVEVGGGDPAVNSRIRVGIASPEMRWFSDADLTPEQDAARSPAFADWIIRNRLGECRLISLVKQDGGLIGAGVVRDSAQGSFATAELAMLNEFGSALRNAVLTQMAIEGDQAAIVAGSFERIGRAVFVCGHDGRILAHSARAERLLAERRWFVAHGGRLQPADALSANDFAALIARLCQGQHVPAAGDDALVLRDADSAPLLVRVHCFPDPDPVRLTRAALVIPCIVEDREHELARIAAQVFGLTPTEALILSHLASGRKPDAIAGLIGVMPSTVRSHLKRIFAKTGTNSQLEVSALLRDLC